MSAPNPRLSKLAFILVVLFGLLVTCHSRAAEKPLPGRSQDVPPNKAKLVGLYRNAMVMAAIDPGSVIKKDDTVSVIVLMAYSPLARTQGMVKNDVSASSGRMLVNCSKRTISIISDHFLDTKGYVTGEVGDTGGPYPLETMPVAKEIAEILCRPNGFPPGTAIL